MAPTWRPLVPVSYLLPRNLVDTYEPLGSGHVITSYWLELRSIKYSGDGRGELDHTELLRNTMKWVHILSLLYLYLLLFPDS